LKSLQNTKKSVYGVNLILYRPGNSDENIDETINMH
jgi:hypothetical protein